MRAMQYHADATSPKEIQMEKKEFFVSLQRDF